MLNKVDEELKKSGLKITSIRKSILKILSNSKKPLSAQEMLSTIKANKTTIYREVETLFTSGYLGEVDFGDRIKRYELSNLGHHHHLICMKCHNIEDITLKETLFDEENLISKNTNFKVLRHNLEFFGYCHNCQ